MTEEQIALARRAVACKGWRWMPGMLTVGNDRVLRVTSNSYDVLYDVRANVMVRTLRIIDPPDLRDPATLGCLLALVREAHGAPFLQVSVSISREHGYRFECNPRHRGAWVESEEEALVAALEAAP